jgi:hypothetical protein
MPESLIQFTEGSGKKVHTFQRTIGANNVEDEVVIAGEQYLASYILTAQAVGLGTANAHLIQVMAGASLRVRIRRIEVWQRVLATAAGFKEMQLTRLTTAGTGGAGVTANPLDPADAAAGFSCQITPTVKGTELGILAWANPYFVQTAAASLSFPQPLFVWDFDRPRSKPLILAAGTANGIALKVITADAAAQVSWTMWCDESSY